MISFKINKIFLVIIFCFATWLIGVQWVLGQSEHTAKLIAEAKKEGEVVIYGTKNLEDANLVAAKFEEKYPFLKVKTNKLSGEGFLTKVLTEVRMGTLFADVLQTNGLGMHILTKEGILGEYLCPEERFYPDKFKYGKYWIGSSGNIHIIAYSIKKVARENLPKSYEDLLKPVWKGKMMMDLGEQWFAGMLQIMGKEKGLNYMRGLSQQDIIIRNISNAMRGQLLVAGEAELDLTEVLGAVEELKNKGASIDWTTLSPTLAIVGGYCISARPFHPTAAKLFLDFVLSKEGQKIFMNLGREVFRSDLLEEKGAFKNLQLIPLDPSAGEHLADYGKQMREIFKRK